MRLDGRLGTHGRIIGPTCMRLLRSGMAPAVNTGQSYDIVTDTVGLNWRHGGIVHTHWMVCISTSVVVKSLLIVGHHPVYT